MVSERRIISEHLYPFQRVTMGDDLGSHKMAIVDMRNKIVMLIVAAALFNGTSCNSHIDTKDTHTHETPLQYQEI